MNHMEEDKVKTPDLTEMDVAMQDQSETQPDPIAQYMESTGTRYEDVVESMSPERQALYDATGTPSGSSIAQKAADYVDKTFFNNVITPELEQAADNELANLSDDELDQLEALWRDASSVPKEIKDKVPNFMRLNQLSEGDTFIQSYVKPTLHYTADLVQGVTMGAMKGLANVPTAAVDVLNWVDDSTGIDIIPNDAVKSLDDATNAFTKGLDDGIPDGLLPSLTATVAQNMVGLGAFKWLPGTGKAMTLFRSALASSTAFGVHGENIFNVMAQYMDEDSTIRSALYTLLAVNEDDPTMIAVVKNSIGSVFTDVATDKLMKALGKVARVFRLRVKQVAEQAVDNVDEAVSGKTVQDITNNIDDADVIRGKSDPVNNREILDISMDDFGLDDDEVKEAVSEFNDTYAKVVKEKANAGTSGKVPPVTEAQQTDAEALLERAQKLMKDVDLDTDFHPTHDVINPKIVKGFTEDEGIERLLQLGNDVPDVNSLGRDASQFTVQHQSEVLAQAKAALEDVEGLTVKLSELAEASSKLPAAIVASRQLLADHTRFLGGLLQKLNRMDVDSAARQLLIDNELTNALLNTAKISSFFDTLSTNVARALKAHQFNMLTPDGNWLKGDVYQNFAAKVADMTAANKVAVARTLADAASPKQARGFLKAFSQSAWKKGAAISAELFYNSILSGVKTGMRNHMGNIIQQGIIMPLDNMARGLLFEDRQAWNDGWKAFWAMRQSLAEAWEVTYKAMRQGINVMGVDSGNIASQQRAFSAVNLGFDVDGSFGRLIDKVGAAINLPTRYLQVSDDFYKQLAMRSNVRTYLWNEAEKLFTQGLAPEGMKKADFIMDYVSKHFGEYFMDVKDSVGDVIKGARLNMDMKEVATRAMDAAKRATFSQELKLGSLSRHVSNAVNDNPALRMVIPFIRVPTNILSEGAAHSPLGIARFMFSDFRNALAAGGAEQQMAVAKLCVGSLFTAGAVAAAYCGNITGAAPRNAKVRDSLYAAGWRPYSFKVGDKWISYDGIEPISTVFGLIADFSQTFKDESGGMDFHSDDGTYEWYERAASGVLSAVSSNLTNKSYMMGLSETLNLLTSDEPQSMIDHLKKLGGVFVPNLATSIRKAMDPSVREVRGFLDGLMNRVPGLSESLPLKYDWLTGEPVHYMGERASGISPFVFSTTEGSSEQKALSQIAGLIPAPQRRVNNNPLTGQQYSDFCRLHGTVKISGKTLKQALAKEYERNKDLSEDELKVKLTDLTLKYRDAAKKELLRNYPELKTNPNKVKKHQRLSGKTNLTASATPVDTVANFV